MNRSLYRSKAVDANHQYGESIPPVLVSVPRTAQLNVSLNLSKEGGSLVAGNAQRFS